jgi:two-component system chemotaxis response regulator CheY
MESKNAARAGIESESGARGLRVLVADDSIFMRDIIRHHLERLGFQVVAEAANGAQALTLFRTLKPDLVTLDVIMPQVDGIDAMAAFRMIKSEAPGVPILIVSAVRFEKTRESFMNEGALDYLVKPFNKNSFDEVRRKLEGIFPRVGNRAVDDAFCADKRSS